jgi:hypothetical protein
LAYYTKKLATDREGNPVPQYYNPDAGVDDYQTVQGKDGAIYVIVKDFLTAVDVRQTGSATLKGAVQNVAAAGTRVQLPNIPCREITLIAKKGNTGAIYVGGTDVTASVYGAELAARDSITLTVSNAYLIWIDASVSGEGISFVAI